MKKKILIIYYSYQGHTKRIANMIHEIIGGDILEIEPMTPYSSDYDTCEALAKKETSTGFQTPILTKCPHFDTYERIFVGSPNWFNTIALPIATFLAQHDWNDKTIFPFCTNGGGGFGNIVNDIKSLTDGAKVMDGLALYEGDLKAKEKLNTWLNENWISY